MVWGEEIIGLWGCRKAKGKALGHTERKMDDHQKSTGKTLGWEES